MNLFEDEATPTFRVNESFATAFETKKRTEELSKLQDKYGANYTLEDEEEEEEDLSTDDEDGEFVTAQVDIAILRTLAKIRKKDPAVYEADRQVFDEEELRIEPSGGVVEKKVKATKPILLKDYQRSRLIADPTDSKPDSISQSDFLPTFAEEERALKREVTNAFHLGGDDSDSGEELLEKRVKGKEEKEKEDAEYSKFLLDNVGDREVEDALEQEEKFLRDYILNRGWIDRNAKVGRIPSYNEVTGGNSPPPSAVIKKVKKVKKALVEGEDDENVEEKDLNVGENDEEDDEYESEADEFENKYNFRFEEAAGQTMMTHARGTSTVRKPTVAVTARARAREAATTRAAEEKLERREEIRRLKALKRKEVEEKLIKLVETAGEGAIGLDGIDLDGDWDGEEHDRKMAEAFGESYGGVVEDDFKPTWDDEIDISDIRGMESASDQSDGEDDEEEMTVEKVVKSKQSKREEREAEGFPIELMEAARQGGGEERRQLLEKMVDDYYNLDYHDKIAGMPVRFHYAKVESSSYNLDSSEILMATDAELNSYMSLRKLAPYRSEEEKRGKSKKRLKELRDALKGRKWGEEIDEDREREEAERYGKRVKWSEVSKASMVEDPESSEQQPKEMKSIRVAVKDNTGTARRAQPTAGPAKRVGKKERERRKLAAVDAGEVVAE